MRNVRRSSRPPPLLPGVARPAWVRTEFSVEMNALFITPFSHHRRFFCQHLLRLPCNLLRHFQDRSVRKDLIVTGRPPPPDDPLLIHEKECSLGIRSTWGKAAVSFGHLQVRKVAEEWVRELE